MSQLKRIPVLGGSWHNTFNDLRAVPRYSIWSDKSSLVIGFRITIRRAL